MTDRLKELRELEKAATPRPWVWATDHGAPRYVQLYSEASIDEYEADVLSASDCEVLVMAWNADLIAAMRNALPALLDVVKAAQGCLASTYADQGQRWAELRDALARLDGDDRG